ncbi:hypothetical protein [Kineococcus radiotolerans]|uniref:Uncharacterized protein n=1 Tax=Kineococcus radiotolerans (strain ATCC BAA-149 / DSM 14245 / SRS30216) TaxID=266940 RepID=A6WAA7_KINRD|nr:hypothetical protein [Kineococcus radiotolerans]ABS03746.1 hypothetical protein Krad_2265 [Kineococcus radiotolerans SRS30216 = ATCC BAA-149]
MSAPDHRHDAHDTHERDERAAHLQAQLDASRAAAATASRRVAGAEDWARLQQRLSTDEQRQRHHRRLRVGLTSAAAACAVVAAGVGWAHLNGGGSSVRVVPATAPSDTTTAIATDADPDAARQPFDASRQGEIVVASHDERGHMAAALQGPLSRVGSCIGVRDILVIWSAGTTWDAATSTLTLPDGSTTRLGDEMKIGGGNSTTETADLSEEAAQALTECGATPGQDIWIM